MSKSKTNDANILVFAGAGASTAVSTEKYPTTVSFFERLPEHITEDALFKAISNFLRSKNGNGTIDIEQVLWEIQNLQQTARSLTDQSSLFAHFAHGNNLGDLLGATNNGFGNGKQLSVKLLNRCEQLTNKINEFVYELYADEPSDKELDSTWVGLLKLLARLNNTIEVFTTNYDLVIETAFDHFSQLPIGDSQVLTAGWQGNVTRSLDRNLWTPSSDTDYDCLLTKLHGSVNWSVRGEEVIIGDTLYKGDHSKHAIIYPGYKSRPDPGIFADFHNHFVRKLASCEIAVFIGFAFRDEYINQLCDRYLPSDTPVYIITYGSEIDHPFDSELVSVFYEGFSSESTKWLMNKLAHNDGNRRFLPGILE